MLKYIILFSIYFMSFNCKTSVEIKKLVVIRSIALDIQEPSGLAHDIRTDTFWTISDKNGNIYNFDINGKIIKKISTDFDDLEGITLNNDGTLMVVNESNNKIIKIDLDGNVLMQYDYKYKSKKDSGLEGITFDSYNELYFLLNEKEPSMLFRTDKNLKEISRRRLKEKKDASGLIIVEDNLVIISDEAK